MPREVLEWPYTVGGGGGGLTKGTIVGKTKSPRREVVRSSAGAGVVYPPFWGVIRVAYPKA